MLTVTGTGPPHNHAVTDRHVDLSHEVPSVRTLVQIRRLALEPRSGSVPRRPAARSRICRTTLNRPPLFMLASLYPLDEVW
jgi:hypothetical protein